MDTGVRSGAIGRLRDRYVATLMVIQVCKNHIYNLIYNI